MRIRLVVVGRQAPFLLDAVAEYRGRLAHYADIEVLAVAPARWPVAPDPATAARLLAEEADRAGRVWQGERRVLLAREGQARASDEIGTWLDRLQAGGLRSLALLVGGPGGVHPTLERLADETWSMGPATYPHTLAAVLVLEQLYRGYRISRGEPYHH